MDHATALDHTFHPEILLEPEDMDELSEAIAHSPTGMALLDRGGVVSHANPRLCDLFGADPVGHRLDQWILEKDSAAALRAALLAGRPWRDECRFLAVDGDPVWCSISIASVPNSRQLRAVAVIDDVTDRRRTLVALEAANSSLVRTNEARQAFVSIVSHELRTPLTAIRGAVELVAHGHAGELGPEQDRFLGMALRNLTRLSAILDDLLDLSKIDAGKLSLSPGEIEATTLAVEVVHAFSAAAEEAGIELELATGLSLPHLWVDPSRLHQVLANLVGNALKFTPSGGRVKVSARRNGPDRIELAVADTGIGIAAENLPHVFERFWQVEDVLTRKRGGSGLGLAIARDIVEAHGGSIVVESTPGHGSTFRVELPIDSAATREMVELEDHLTPHRRYPHFSMLLLEPHEAGDAGVTGVAVAAKALLPRNCDEILLQPASGRIVVILGTTDRAGAEVVRRRLEKQLAEIAVVHGPGVFPDDGHSAQRLVHAAIAVPPPSRQIADGVNQPVGFQAVITHTQQELHS